MFGLTPRQIIEGLDLLRPIYEKTAAYGHFGRTEKSFTWERTDKKEALAEAAGLSRIRAVAARDQSRGAALRPPSAPCTDRARRRRALRASGGAPAAEAR